MHDRFNDIDKRITTTICMPVWTLPELEACRKIVFPEVPKDLVDDIYEEVELRLRSSLSAHKATGYEILFRCSKTDKAYTQIVRWNGPLGDFTYLDAAGGSKFGVANGDVVKATIVGKVITAYINGVKVLQATDDTYPGGSPGMGFYLEGAGGVNEDYGFTRFTASAE